MDAEYVILCVIPVQEALATALVVPKDSSCQALDANHAEAVAQHARVQLITVPHVLRTYT